MPENISHIAEELDFRYRDNVVGVADNKDKYVSPYHIDRVRLVDRDRGKGMECEFSGSLTPQKSKTRAYKIYVQTYREVNFVIPSLGMVNGAMSCLWMSRTPTRQYQKGLTGSVISTHLVSLNELRYLGKNQSTWSSVVMLRKIFNKEYESVQNAIESVRRFKMLSAAFSDKYCVINKIGYKSPLIGYKNVIIGFIDKHSRVHIRPGGHHLYEELSEYITCIRSNTYV